MSNHPADLFADDGCDPVNSLGFTVYKFEPYPRDPRRQIGRGPGGKTRRLSEIPSTRDLQTIEDDYSTMTAKMRLSKPVPAAVVVEFGEMLGLDDRSAFESGGYWSLWLGETPVRNRANKQQATSFCLTGAIK